MPESFFRTKIPFLVSLLFKPGARRPQAGARLVSWNCFCPGSQYACVCVCVCVCVCGCVVCVRPRGHK